MVASTRAINSNPLPLRVILRHEAAHTQGCGKVQDTYPTFRTPRGPCVCVGALEKSWRAGCDVRAIIESSSRRRSHRYSLHFLPLTILPTAVPQVRFRRANNVLVEAAGHSVLILGKDFADSAILGFPKMAIDELPGASDDVRGTEESIEF